MPYIYKIINDINDKVYVGKTIHSLEKRFQEHCRDATRERNEKRPLYNAIQKYGIEHFQIEMIEECDTDILSEREKYWIEYYQSYKNGYNATLGGDGKILIDRNKVQKIYEETKNMKEVSKLLNISIDAVSYILKELNVQTLQSGEFTAAKTSHKVKCIDLNDNEIMQFNSQMDAARWLQKYKYPTNKNLNKISYAIGRVVSGKRKTAYGFLWKRI